MLTNKQMFDYISTINDFYQSINNYHLFAAQQFANTIAVKTPKFIFKNKELEKKFNQDAEENNLLKINYELVRLSSLFGSAFLGCNWLTDTNNNKKLFFTVAKLLHVKKIGNEFVELNLILDFIKINNSSFFVIENWNLNNNKFLCKRFGFDLNLRKITDLQVDKLKDYQTNLNPLKDRVPYVEFNANPFGMSDLYNVPKELFVDFNDHLKLLRTDSIVNKGILMFNTGTSQSNKKSAKELTDIFKDPSKIVFENASNYSLLTNEIMQFIQGKPNGSTIIEKLKYYDQQIKKFGFIRTNTASLGTKNTNNSEIDTLNADADDYLETKANLLEISWKQFIDKVYAPIYGFEEDVKVECTGSTKYLQNAENVYIQNQNSTLNNPNDLTYNNKEIKNEIKRDVNNE